MAITNQQRLTRGGQKYAAKKKAASVPEVKFDPESRKDYLTGFHTRKLARQAEARRKAEEMNRAARLAERQKIREDRKAAINKGMERLKEAEEIIDGKIQKQEGSGDAPGELSDDGEEFTGFKETNGILKRSVYGDSQVTFEEINLDPYVDIKRSEEVLNEATEKAQNYAAYVEQIEGRNRKQEEKEKVVKRKKKFRYLPKSERRMMNRKNKVR